MQSTLAAPEAALCGWEVVLYLSLSFFLCVGALPGEPLVKALLLDGPLGQPQIKSLSAILRWLRGTYKQRRRLAEFNEDTKCLKLYLDFVTQASAPHASRVVFVAWKGCAPAPYTYASTSTCLQLPGLSQL